MRIASSGTRGHYLLLSLVLLVSRLSSISRETRDIGEIMMTAPNAPDGRSDSHGTYAMRHREPL